MEQSKKHRKKRRDRKHAVYRVVIGDQAYIGATVIVGTVGKSLKARLAKHWYRRNDPTRYHWRIYEAMRAVERDEARIELVEVVRGKALAHVRERALIKELGPQLNTDCR